MAQRLLDVLFAGLALLVLLPLLLIVAMILRVTGEHEIFYRQARVGRDGRLFGLLKFATMLKESPNIGTGTITVKGDARILPFGRMLRKSKINELPQLLNIILGDMSVIGPRPMTENNFIHYPQDARTAIATVRPGLSGIGSIVFRDEEELLHVSHDPRHAHSLIIAPYKAALEQWYVRHHDLGTYLALISLTAWAVAFPKSRLVWRLFPSLPNPSPELDALFARAGSGSGRG